ncbi:MAG: carboxypeptidase-like regulatory domain-containing protein, partial [Candidatus Marinimicrobia bacterium]|nr:carboxypeptidase-like regulatory domain-containing protein [Candidatus Neomarinimicrobiota bacterium]
MKQYTWILFLCLFLTGITSGQSDRIAGKIRGTVTDGTNGDPLIGANALVLPAEYGRGAMTDVNGQFVIPNIPAGSYDIQVSYIGYASHIVRDVKIVPGLTVSLNFALNVEAIEGQAVDVVAQRDQEVVTVKTTTSKIVVTGEDIQKMPVSNFTELLANTGGVVEVEAGRSRGIHLRGGRSGEVAFFVDGVMTNDPVDRSQGVEIDNEAIESIVITKGGFSVEYGEAMSGVVSIVTKSGSKENFSGSFEHEGDGLMPEGGLNNGYSRSNFSLGGPIPFLKGIMSFYINGTWMQGDQAYVRSQKLDHSSYTSPQGTFKLTFSPKYSSFNATVSANFDRSQRY